MKDDFDSCGALEKILLGAILVPCYIAEFGYKSAKKAAKWATEPFMDHKILAPLSTALIAFTAYTCRYEIKDAALHPESPSITLKTERTYAHCFDIEASSKDESVPLDFIAVYRNGKLWKTELFDKSNARMFLRYQLYNGNDLSTVKIVAGDNKGNTAVREYLILN